MKVKAIGQMMSVSFMRGTWSAVLFLLAFQDYLGKERFLAFCEQNWIHLPWIVCAFPALILCLIQVQSEQKVRGVAVNITAIEEDREHEKL